MLSAPMPVDAFASFAPASSAQAPAHDPHVRSQRRRSRPAEKMVPTALESPSAVQLISRPSPSGRGRAGRSNPRIEPAIEAGPDLEVLATLARLERFLGAIESLRA